MTFNNKLLLLVCLLYTGHIASGQDFEADSVYYTPISKNAETPRATRPIFKDTIQNDQMFEYFFNVQLGPMIGCKDCQLGKEVTFSVATTHGVTIGKKLRAGIGIGFDSYFDWNTLPIFGSASWDLFGTKNTQALFVVANYGWSKAWVNETLIGAGATGVGGGAMFNAQLGYRVKYHDVRIGLAIGSKYQRAYRYYEYPSYYYRSDGVMVPGSPSRTTIKQNLNRLMISVTVGWK